MSRIGGVSELVLAGEEGANDLSRGYSWERLGRGIGGNYAFSQKSQEPYFT